MNLIWKVVTVVATLAALAGSLYGIKTKVAWADEVEQSMSIMGRGIQLRFDTQQLQNAQDRKRDMKRFLVANPNDVDAQVEIDYLNERIHILKQRIEKNTMELGNGQ